MSIIGTLINVILYLDKYLYVNEDYLNKANRVYEKNGSMAITFLIALSRLYLYVHYPTDVIAGIIFGKLCSNLIALDENFKIDRMCM